MGRRSRRHPQRRAACCRPRRVSHRIACNWQVRQDASAVTWESWGAGRAWCRSGDWPGGSHAPAPSFVCPLAEDASAVLRERAPSQIAHLTTQCPPPTRPASTRLLADQRRLPSSQLSPSPARPPHRRERDCDEHRTTLDGPAVNSPVSNCSSSAVVSCFSNAVGSQRPGIQPTPDYDAPGPRISSTNNSPIDAASESRLQFFGRSTHFSPSGTCCCQSLFALPGCRMRGLGSANCAAIALRRARRGGQCQRQISLQTTPAQCSSVVDLGHVVFDTSCFFRPGAIGVVLI
jgi:hypothetical protein